MALWSCAVGFILLGVALCAFATRRNQAREMVKTLLSDYKPSASLSPTTVTAHRLTRDLSPRARAWVVGAMLCVCARFMVPGVSPAQVGLASVVGALVGELYWSRATVAREQGRQRMIEVYLPAVMERVVMGVGAGLDIVPAIDEATRDSADPVSKLLRQVLDLVNQGTSVDSALEAVATAEKSIGIRHAFIHLGLAHRQGGELIRPLKELSDATQVAYQEGVEEAIAKLPAKAVMPLVLTFTGLIICFLTVPLLQVGSIAHKVAHVARP